MGAKWYYMARTWIRRSRRVGPISEGDLLLRIDRGKIGPETLLQSSKTRGKWVPMSSVGPAMERWRQAHPEKADPDRQTDTSSRPSGGGSA